MRSLSRLLLLLKLLPLPPSLPSLFPVRIRLRIGLLRPPFLRSFVAKSGFRISLRAGNGERDVERGDIERRGVRDREREREREADRASEGGVLALIADIVALRQGR